MGININKIDENNFGEKLNSKGFLVANFNKILNFSRADLLLPMTFGFS